MSRGNSCDVIPSPRVPKVYIVSLDPNFTIQSSPLVPFDSCVPRSSQTTRYIAGLDSFTRCL